MPMLTGVRYLFWDECNPCVKVEAEFVGVRGKGRLAALCDDQYIRYWDCGGVVNPQELAVESSQVTCEYELESFTIEAYITVKAVSVENAVDRVRDDLDEFGYINVSLGYL